jgi:hypothetical protein
MPETGNRIVRAVNETGADRSPSATTTAGPAAEQADETSRFGVPLRGLRKQREPGQRAGYETSAPLSQGMG